MRTAPFIVMVLLVVCGPGPQSAGQARHITGAPFPLVQGTYWVYEGTVRWTPAGSSEVLEKQVHLRMEVIETLDHRAVVAARVKGHPMDLTWYEEGRQPRDYLILQVWQDRYYLLQGERAQEALKRLRTEQTQLGHLANENELFLELPLVERRAFGETSQLTREDRFYCWVVGQRRDDELEGVKGATKRPLTVWEVSQRTIGGVQSFEFAAGLGFTRYRYHHNGTVSEFDLKLVEFSRGR